MRYLRNLLAICIMLIAGAAHAQDLSTYSHESFSRHGDTLNYRMLTPASYDIQKKYPLIIFLHGAGERGWDNNAQLLHGGTWFLKDSIRNQFPAFVIFPQCPSNTTWAPMHMKMDSAKKKIGGVDFPLDENTVPATLLKSLLDSLLATGRIDIKRVYIGGLSLGGMGTFYMITRYPDVFAAAFPICGAGNVAAADCFANKVPVWIFHGGADPVVPVQASRAYNEKLQSLGAKVKYTEFPGVGHNSWDNVFVEPGVIPWLMEQHKQ